MDSKKKEVIVTVHNTEELEAVDRNVFRYTAEPVVKKYIEDFCDEDTGEVVSIGRKGFIFDKGRELSSDDFSELLFNLQCEYIKEVRLSNIQRQGNLVSGMRFHLWNVKVDGARKLKMLLRADNALLAYEVAKDYIELNYKGDFFIKSIKDCDESIIIEPKEDDESKEVFKNWYSVDVLIDIECDPGKIETVGPYHFIVYAETVEAAKVIIEHWIAHKRAEQEETDKYSIKLAQATTIGANVIVPMEFCMDYRKGGEE